FTVNSQPFFFQCARDLRYLHSLPTRRSSDLRAERALDLLEDGLLQDHSHHRAAECQGRLTQTQLLDDGVDVQGEGSRSTIHDLADRKSTRLNSSHQIISYAVFCSKTKNYGDQ